MAAVVALVFLIYVAGTNNPVTVNFSWKRIKTSMYYVLYVSKDSLFNNIVKNDTVYIDTIKTLNGFDKDTKYFWKIESRDSSGETDISYISNFTTVPPIQINIKLLFEGMYYSLFNFLGRKDSVIIYLHLSVPPYIKKDSAKSSIDSISFTGNFKFYNASAGNYYVTVKHLNSIETWSKSGGQNLLADGNINYYDFTTAISQAYGNNLKLKGSKYCIYGGNVNGDAIVDGGDLSEVDNDSFTGLTGRFLRSDVNGDNIVDAADVSLVDNNSYNSVVRMRP